MLATAASYYVKLWNLNNENDIVSVKERSSCMPHGSSNVLCMEWTQDCSLIGTAGSDGCLVLCIPDSGIFSEVIPTGRLKNNKNDEIRSMKFYNKSNLIVFGGSGQIVKCWDRQFNKFLNNFTGHTKTISSMDINHSETNVSSVSENGDILINSLDGKTSILKNISKNPLNKIIYSKNSNANVYCVDDHGFVYLYDTINLIKDSPIQISDSTSINDITISPLNNNILVTANEEGTIKFIDIQSKKIVNTYKANDPLTSVSIKPDGSMLACGTSRGQVLLYDIRMNKQLHKFWAETKSIKTLRFQKFNINNNRKRTQSIMTLENNTINPKKHMLSSESDDLDTLRHQSSESSVDQDNRPKVSIPTTPKTPKTTNSNSIATNNVTPSSIKNNITNNLLSAFSSKKYQPKAPLFPSTSNNSSFDYNFNKNKPIKLKSNNNSFQSNEATINNNKGNKNNNTVLTFAEFLKNNYSKGASIDTNEESALTNQDPFLSPSAFSNIPSPSSTNNTNITPKMEVITLSSKEEDNKKIGEKAMNEKEKAKSKLRITTNNNIKNDHNKNSNNNNNKNNKSNNNKNNNNSNNTTTNNIMDIDSKETPFNDIWLNPEVFASPTKDQEDKFMETLKEPSTTSSYMNLDKESTITSTSNFGTSFIPPDKLSPLGMNSSMYEQYIDDNTGALRERLKKNIKEELRNNGISVVNGDDEGNKLDEGLATVSNKILESVVDEGLQELKSFLRNDIKNMHLEIIGQFHSQKYEIEKMFRGQHEKIGPLLTELQKLREENERLRCQIYKT